MGARGPQRKPTALKIAQGNPGRRRLNEGEPVPPPGPVDPPPWLTDNERAMGVWRELTPVMIAMRVLTTADRLTFARYCVAFGRYLELQEVLWRKGVAGTCYRVQQKPNGKGGYPVELPMAAELRRLHVIMKELEDRFGLTPSARARLSVPPGETPQAVTSGPAPASYRISDFNQGAGPAVRPAHPDDHLPTPF